MAEFDFTSADTYPADQATPPAESTLTAQRGGLSVGQGLVLVTNPFPPELMARIADAAAPAQVRQVPAAEIDDRLSAAVEVLYTQNALPRPDAAPALCWVQLHLAGVEDVV